MARITITSRDLGEIEFRAADAGGYAWVTFPGRPARQIGAGGSFSGNMLTANQQTLARVARSWYRSFRAALREFKA